MLGSHCRPHQLDCSDSPNCQTNFDKLFDDFFPTVLHPDKTINDSSATSTRRPSDPYTKRNRSRPTKNDLVCVWTIASIKSSITLMSIQLITEAV